MRRVPVPLLTFVALLLAGCSGTTRATAGFGGAWREFLELDGQAASPAPGAARVSVDASPAGLTEQIRQLYLDSNTYLAGFPGVEEKYDSLLAAFRAQLDRERAAMDGPNAEAARRLMSDTINDVNDSLDRQHKRTTAVSVTFDQRLKAVLQAGAQMEKICSATPPGSASEQARECISFSDAYSLMKEKAELVQQGFARVDSSYQSAVQLKDDLIAKARGSAPGSAPQKAQATPKK